MCECNIAWPKSLGPGVLQRKPRSGLQTIVADRSACCAADGASHRSDRRVSRTVRIVLLAVLCQFLSLAVVAAELSGRVVSIADGDTVTVLGEQYTQHKVRVAGIDAPEKSQPFGKRSRQNLGALVFGKDVRVEWSSATATGASSAKFGCPRQARPVCPQAVRKHGTRALPRSGTAMRGGIATMRATRRRLIGKTTRPPKPTRKPNVWDCGRTMIRYLRGISAALARAMNDESAHGRRLVGSTAQACQFLTLNESHAISLIRKVKVGACRDRATALLSSSAFQAWQWLPSESLRVFLQGQAARAPGRCTCVPGQSNGIPRIASVSRCAMRFSKRILPASINGLSFT